MDEQVCECLSMVSCEGLATHLGCITTSCSVILRYALYLNPDNDKAITKGAARNLALPHIQCEIHQTSYYIVLCICVHPFTDG